VFAPPIEIDVKTCLQCWFDQAEPFYFAQRASPRKIAA
jgi:hypothetical protein